MPLDPCLGQIILFASNFAPSGWALCNGQLLAINQNQSLFSLLGTIYGGDGRTTFALPDLRGRVPVHVGVGNGPGLSSYSQGQKTGVENVFLNTADLPAHTHSATTTIQALASANQGDSSSPTGKAWAASAAGDNDYGPAGAVGSLVPMDPNALSAGTTLGNTGSSTGHTNIMPVLAINYIIALVGLFPSRN